MSNTALPTATYDTVSAAEGHAYILRCLLNYHERMMLPLRDRDDCQNASMFTDVYANALREGIRCIEQVHGISHTSH